jgi:protein TonB
MKSCYQFLFATIVLFISLYTSAQPFEGSIYVLDENWRGTEIKKAKYLLRVKQINDTCWQWDSYHLLGPLIRTEYTKDKNGAVAHGRVYFYNSNGRVDSIHNYRDGLADGEWYYNNDTGRTAFSKIYSLGTLIRTRDLIREADSINQLRGQIPGEAIEEIESEFPGTQKAWAKFLSKNLKYPERAINNNIQGEVWVEFVIDTLGNIEDIRIARSVEFSLDEEAIRLIRQSPRWTPARQGGRKLRSFKRQPINFRLE